MCIRDRFLLDGLSIPLDGYEFGDGSKREGKAIIGLRPEHILTGDNLASAAVKTKIKVELIEPMGSDTLIYSSLANNSMHVRMDGQVRVSPGDLVEIGFQSDRVSLFDPETDNRL